MQAPKAEATGYTWLTVQSLSPPPNTSIRRGDSPLSPHLQTSRGSFELKPLDIQTRLPPGVFPGAPYGLPSAPVSPDALRRTATAWDIRLVYTRPVSYPAACRQHSLIDHDHCEIIEELYREIVEAEDRDTLQYGPTQCRACRSPTVTIQQ